MSRTFKKVDYDQEFDLKVHLGNCLPSDHLASFKVIPFLKGRSLNALGQYGEIKRN